MKIGYARELTVKVLEKAKKERVQSLIFTRIESSISKESLAEFTCYDTGKLTKEGKDYTYAKVGSQLQNIATIVPSMYQYRNYDLKIALHKELYWSKIADYLNEQKCIELKTPDAVFVDLDEKRNILGNYLKFFLLLFKPAACLIGLPENTRVQGKIAIRINSVKALPFFGDLFKELGTTNFFSFQSNESGIPTQTSKQLIEKGFQNVSFSFKSKVLMAAAKNYLKLLFREDIVFLNNLIDSKNKLQNIVEAYEAMAKAGVKGFLLNAGENEGEGIIAGIVANNFGCKAFNFMNGTKAKDPINQYTTFQYWFMHDEQMREMFLSYSNQKKENLLVVGHLMEEEARNHQSAGTLAKYEDLMKGKKIIALFSSIVYSTEFRDVVELIYEYLNENQDCLVLVRQHPSERMELTYVHERIILLPDFKEKSSLALFDLLQAANVSISFGSTVSKQASWFGIPSCTIEYSEKSLLYYVDQKNIHHFNSVKPLHEYLNNALKQPKVQTKNENSTTTVAKKITQYLLS